MKKQRSRKEVEKDGTRPDILCLEVLLDLRDLLNKQIKKNKNSKK